MHCGVSPGWLTAAIVTPDKRYGDKCKIIDPKADFSFKKRKKKLAVDKVHPIIDLQTSRDLPLWLKVTAAKQVTESSLCLLHLKCISAPFN